MTSCSCAAFKTAAIGEGRVLPVANQLSSSTTQKSGSLCVTIACVFVIVISESFVFFSSSVSSSSSSKFISEKVGIDIGDSSNASSSWMSKSVGSGKTSVAVEFVSGAGSLFSGLVNFIGCSFARANALRISSGISSDNVSSVFLSAVFCSAVGAGVVFSGCVFVVGIFIFLIHFGIGISNNGLFCFVISALVAMYNGPAASIIMPKTKPAKPCNSACIRRCHCAALNMLKLNKNFKRAHKTNTYPTVHVIKCLCLLKNE